MSHATFDRRVRALARKHERMSLGISYRVGRDGLITAHPRRATPRLPLRGLAIIVLTGLLLKAALFALLGEEAYGSRLAALQQGSAVEQAGAWLMQPDPVSGALAEAVGAVLR